MPLVVDINLTMYLSQIAEVTLPNLETEAIIDGTVYFTMSFPKHDEGK